MEQIVEFLNKKQIKSDIFAKINERAKDIKNIPPHLQTEDVCIAALKINKRVLKYIHPSRITSRLSRISVNIDGKSLRYVPPHLQTEKLCLDAVSENGLALKYVHNQTIDICQTAVYRTYSSKKYIKKELYPEIDTHSILDRY